MAIIRKQATGSKKEASPLMGFLLFLISIVLLVLTGPLGLIYGIFHALFTRGFRGIGEYFLKIAVSIDQLGNVLMQHLLNILWIKEGGYKFGNRDETISSALGRNKQLDTLTYFGRVMEKILDSIDPNHALNSIDYYIEPKPGVIDELGWLLVRDKKVLLIRHRDQELFVIPGGKRRSNESDAAALARAVKDKLNVDLDLGSLQFSGHFESKGKRSHEGLKTRIAAYTAGFKGKFKPSTEIVEMTWMAYSEREKTSAITRLILDELRSNGAL